MNLALLLARLVLTVVFVVAGVAKLADLVGSQQTLRDFGVPAPLARPLGVLLPLAELTVAVTLLFPVLAWWGALVAGALLLLFAVGIGANLVRGRTPDCHCFGQLHSTPAGWPTLLRNLVLVAIAGFVVALGRASAGLSPLDWVGALPVAQRLELLSGLVLFGLLVLEGWGWLQTMRQQGRMLLRLEALETQPAAAGSAIQSGTAHGLPVGTPAPAFRLAPLFPSSQPAEMITLEMLRAKGKPVVLVFSDPDCGPCTALLPEASRWQRDYAGKLTLVFVSRGIAKANRRKASEHGITQVLLQQDREVAEAYQAYGTPSAVLVRPDGVIGSPLAQGADAIRVLVTQVASLPALYTLPMVALSNGNAGKSVPSQPAGPKMGELAPVFALPDLSGKTISLADFRGEKTLVLFWNPDCGFCQQMLDDLKAWEANSLGGVPRLLVVSTGTVEANKALGLRSPVVLDEGFHVGHLFGAGGTPMAVLVDADGSIASQVAEGASAVFTLAGAS